MGSAHTQAVLRPCRPLWGLLFARSRAAGPGPLPLPSPGSGRAARRRFAARVRRFRPRFARPGRAALALPPLSRSALCGLSPSFGSRWPRLPLAPLSLRCGLPVRSPFLRSRLGLVQRVAPRGVAAGPLRCPSSLGPPPSGSPLRLRARRLLPRPPGGFAAFFPLRGPGLFVLARPAGLRFRFAVAASRAAWACFAAPRRASRLLPCAPPPRRPRWGLRGARGPFRGACGPPPCVPLFAGLSAAPPGLRAGPRCPFPGSVDTPENVNRGSAARRVRPFYRGRQGFPLAGLRSQRRRRCGARPGLDCPAAGKLPRRA